eukprot:848527-Pyramimonas_sp.AAC.1
MVYGTLFSWGPSSHQLVCVKGRSEGATAFTGYLWFSGGGTPPKNNRQPVNTEMARDCSWHPSLSRALVVRDSFATTRP